MKSLKRNLTIILASLAALPIVANLSLVARAGAEASVKAGIDAVHGSGQPTDLFGTAGIFTTVTNTLLYIVGALSVIMLIYGGLRYVVSGGNNSSVTAAKNTIIYAIVGLVIAFLSFAIINFVLNSINLSSSGGGTWSTL